MATVTLPLLKPGLANAFLVGFIESIADFGNPVVVGAGQFSVLSTDIFFAIVGAQFDQGRAATLAWILTLFALGVFALQRGLLGKQNYTTVSKGDSGIPMPLPGWAAPHPEHRVVLPRAGVHPGRLSLRLHRWIRPDLGTRLHLYAEALRDRFRY